MLGAPLGALACREEGRPPSPDTGAAPAAPVAELPPVTRPVLLPFGQDAVHIVDPPHELPVAYVSMATRQVFLDHDYRDQAYWDLRAHISVSTGVWRIPLAGDPPNMPVMPGDTLREFEEVTMRDWDPRQAPAEGDVRILRGSPTPALVDLDCVPLAGGGAWLRGGPWEIRRSGPPDGALCREDFQRIGRGERFADRDCTRPAGSVELLTWAWTEQPRVEGG